MKKKILIITSVILIIGLLCATLVGCKSAAEKEAAYYEKVAAALEKTTGTLSTLTDELFSKSWTANFVLATTFYKQEIKDDDGNVEYVDMPITRGNDKEAGWPSDCSLYVKAIAYEVTYNSSDDYSYKATTFKDVSRSDYLSKIGKKNFQNYFDVEEEYEYSTKDGADYNYLNPIAIIKSSTDTEELVENGISASDNFRIYTHFMRVESRVVYGEDSIITKEVNDASAAEDGTKAYWNNYGDDITYNWDKVYGMQNNRLTVLYSKGKKRINSLEIYNESIISYYTKNNKVDTSLVLKADVIMFTEAVVEFKYN